MQTERDTHFQGFAKLVAQEIGSNFGIIFDTAYKPEEAYLERISQIIAQRAYDLVFHLLGKSDPLYLDMSGYHTDEDIHQNIAHLPDLTQWPEAEP